MKFVPPAAPLLRSVFLTAFFFSHTTVAEVRCAGRRVERIVIGAHASAVEQFAARELQSYFREMGAVGSEKTGDLPIVQTDTPEPGSGIDILLGQAGANLVKTDAATLGDDGYCIQRLGANLVLTGPQPRSALFAVYHVLESCGVRFFGYRARGGEIVPHRETIEIPDRAVVEKPAMKYRFVSDNGFDASDHEKLAAVADWAVKNRCNVFTLTPSRAGETWEEIALDEVRKRGLLIAGPGHVLAQFTPGADLFATHPEYFPLRDGKRVAKVAPEWGGVPSFCASNPAAMEIVVSKAAAYLDRHPFIDLFAIYPPDGSQHGAQCQCEACAKRSASDWYLAFINRVAQGVATTHPAAKVLWISYNECGVPPKTERPADGGRNLVLLWCNDLRNFREPMDTDANRQPAPYLAWKPRLKSIKTDWMPHPGDRDLAAWHRWKGWADFLRASQYRGDVVLLEYYNAHVANSLRVPSLGFCQSGPWPPGGMARDFQFYRAEGIDGWQNCTDYYNDAPNPYWNWLSAQLLWNPEADVARLDADFYAQLYGAASGDMQRYFAVVWSGIARVEEPSDLLPALSESEPILHRAETMSVPPEAAARIKAVRAFQERSLAHARAAADPAKPAR